MRLGHASASETLDTYRVRMPAQLALDVSHRCHGVDLAGAPTFGVLAERDTPRAWVDKLAADHRRSLLINPHTHWAHHRRQTTLAVWQAKAVLEAGGQVIYIHFEEASPHGIIHRLKGIGVAVDVIRRQFHWGHVNSPWKWGEMAKEIELEQPHN